MHIILLLMSLISLPAAAAEGPALSATNIMHVIGPLLLVLALIFILAKAVKRFNFQTIGMNQGMSIVTSIPLSNQAKLCLVKVGDKDILIGVTQQQVTHIETFNEPVIEQTPPPTTNELSKQFSRILHPKKKA